MKCLSFVVILLFLSSMLQAQIPQVVAGRIERVENFQSKYVTARNVDIWLPDSYPSGKKYNVLYMHDGQMLFDAATTWNKQSWDADDITDSLLKKEKIKNVIIVAIWNGGNTRHTDYFPQRPFESLTTQQQEDIYAAARSNGASVFNEPTIHSDNYLKFLVTELKPYIDHRYRVYKDRSHTFIAGSSMGGLISMYAICEYPNVFGGAACLSTHWPGIFSMEGNPIPDVFIRYLQTHLPNPKKHKIYFDHGTATLDALYPPIQKKADAVLKAKGYTDKKWMTKVFPGEEHSEMAWHKRLAIPLTFLLGK